MPEIGRKKGGIDRWQKLRTGPALSDTVRAAGGPAAAPDSVTRRGPVMPGELSAAAVVTLRTARGSTRSTARGSVRMTVRAEASPVRTGLNYSFGTKKYCHQIRNFHGILTIVFCTFPVIINEF